VTDIILFRYARYVREPEGLGSSTCAILAYDTMRKLGTRERFDTAGYAMRLSVLNDGLQREPSPPPARPGPYAASLQRTVDLSDADMLERFASATLDRARAAFYLNRAAELRATHLIDHTLRAPRPRTALWMVRHA
jgi:hypothetical protein